MPEALMLQWVLWLPMAGLAALLALPAAKVEAIRRVTFWVMLLQFVLVERTQKGASRT